MDDYRGVTPRTTSEVDSDTKGILEVLEGARRSRGDPDIALVLLVAAVSSGGSDPRDALENLLRDASTD